MRIWSVSGVLAAVVAFSVPAPAQSNGGGAIEARAPETKGPKILRVAPVAGPSAFAREENGDFDDLGEGTSAGLFVDVARNYLSYQTGLVFTSAEAERGQAPDAGDIDYWSVPLVLKANFSGKPHETVFAKAGLVLLSADSPEANLFEEYDLMGQLGLGSAVPLSRARDVAVVLDAAYNRLLTREGVRTDFAGYQIMAGLSFLL